MGWKFNHEADTIWDAIGISKDEITQFAGRNLADSIKEGDDKTLVLIATAIATRTQEYSTMIPYLFFIVSSFCLPPDQEKKKTSYLVEGIYNMLKAMTPEQRIKVIKNFKLTSEATDVIIALLGKSIFMELKQLFEKVEKEGEKKEDEKSSGSSGFVDFIKGIFGSKNDD